LFGYLRPVRERAKPPLQGGRLDEILDNQHPDEVSIPFAKRHELAGREIVRLDAPSGLEASVIVANGDGSLLPSRGQNGCVDRQTMNVESKRVMEL
jgi:hypothetical protein